MKATTATVLLILSLLLAACGGGNGGGVDSATSDMLDDVLEEYGKSCDNDYYRELLGTYRGQAIYDASGANFTAQCVWTLEARVEVKSDTLACFLRVAIQSDLEQSTVLPGDDEDAYQCVEINGVRSLYDPNKSTDPSSFDDVTFPVTMNYQNKPVSQFSPYFGDDRYLVRNVHLLDGSSSLVDLFLFDGKGGFQMVPDGQGARFFNAVLNKE